MAPDRVLAFIDANLEQSLERLFALLRIPSISTDAAFAGECRRAAEWLAAELSTLGFDASVRPTTGRPMVVAHSDAARAQGPRVLFYGHYDVQPPDPLQQWNSPPFEPRLVETDGRKRIVARGAADDKGQLMTFMEACRAFIAAEGKLPLPVTILFEGEEETGSPSLKPFLDANKDELKADVALVCDTDMWDAGTPAVTTMLRGLVLEEVIVQGTSHDLHSGLFGGPAINAIHVLARVLAEIHGTDGRVAIPGFYDGVDELDPEIRMQWTNLGFDERRFLDDIGQTKPAGEQGRSLLELMWARPTCDVNGIVGGYTGEGDPGPRVGEGLVSSGRRSEPLGGPRCVPRVRARPVAGRLQGGIHLPWRQPGAAAATCFAVPDEDQSRPRSGIRPACRAQGFGRIDPDRRRLSP